MGPGLRSPTEPREGPGCSRRQFLNAAGAVPLALADAGTKANAPRRLRVAAVYTVFNRASHAFGLLENFLEPYLFNDRRIDPAMDVVSFYADQTPARAT